MTFFLACALSSATVVDSYGSRNSTNSTNSTSQLTNTQPINGVVMKGIFVNMKQDKNDPDSAPDNYIEDSLKEISEAGLDHARFLFYWEAYERDPEAFMKEIKSVAEAADKYGVKIIYDNHQWHTSSWLEDRGTGFPWSLFEGEYSRGGGGNTDNSGAQEFWADWWDRSVKGDDGKDGWTLMAEFLKEIVSTVDNHSSTLGYEILSEPHVDNIDQWSKIGIFNSFMTNELRKTTDKTVVYSMNVPVDLNGPIKVSPENLAKMAPSDKKNVVFKISVYGIPDRDDYQKERFDMFLETRDLTGVPLYIGEWNNVVRVRDGGVFKINPGQSELTKSNAGEILGALKEAGMWGTAFWKWDFRDADTESFNLLSDGNGQINPTKHFDILEDTVKSVYGSTDLKNSIEPVDTEQAASVDTEQAASVDTESGTEDANQNNMINELVKTGKFTDDEAKEIVTKSIQTGTDPALGIDTASGTDTPSSNTSLNSNMAGDSDTARTSNNENNSTANQSSDANTNPEDYDDLNELIDDIKNKRVDFEISLNAFKNSGVYQGTDGEMQDCIDLAGKIGDNLIDYEIVRCSEDTNFFKNQLSSSNDNNVNNR
ncbi:MAG: glycoside hydrolase family 5 protein [Nitrososphaerota archaeon]